MTKRPEYSIKRRLIVSFYIGAVIVWLLIIYGSNLIIRDEVDELFDGELSQLARVLMTLYTSNEYFGSANPNQALVTAPPFEGDDNYERKLVFQIWGENQTLLVRSSNAPVSPIAEKINEFETRRMYSSLVRVYALWIPQFPYVIHVGQKLEIRSDLSQEILQTFYYLVILVFPIILLVIYWGVNKALGPLKTIAEEISQRSSDNFEPVNIEKVPTEIKTITDELNNLLARLKAAFKRERQFIANASHELRTPLAGLKAQAQVALKDKSRVEKSLTHIIEGVDRTSNLANQLLSLSRLDAEKVELKKQPVNLLGLVNQVCHDLDTTIRNKRIRVEKTIAQAFTVNADQDMMYIMFRNLIENAVQHSPNDSSIQLELHTNENDLHLEIMDQGRGISQTSLERVFDRFYRDIDSESSGSGLGLAIVKQIAVLHGFDIELSNREDQSGLKVSVHFNQNHD